MSGGRVNTPPSDGSVDPLKRISELERLWPIMQTKMQNYDNMASSLEAIKEELKAIKSKCEAQVAEVKSLDSSKNGLDTYVKGKVDYFNDQIGKLASHFHGISARVEGQALNLSTEIEGLKNTINSHQKNLSAELQKKVGATDLNNVVAKNNDSHSVVQAGQQQIKKSIGDVVNQVNGFSAEMSVWRDFLKQLTAKIEALSQDQKSLSDSLSKHKDQLNTQLYGALQKTSAEVDEKLKLMKSSLADAPDSLRTELMKKLEGIALDGSNAILRSTNALAQVNIVEKKLENVLLRLKAMEIA